MKFFEVIVITKHGLLLMAQNVKSLARRSRLIMRDQEKQIQGTKDFLYLR